MWVTPLRATAKLAISTAKLSLICKRRKLQFYQGVSIIALKCFVFNGFSKPDKKRAIKLSLTMLEQKCNRATNARIGRVRVFQFRISLLEHRLNANLIEGLSEPITLKTFRFNLNHLECFRRALTLR